LSKNQAPSSKLQELSSKSQAPIGQLLYKFRVWIAVPFFILLVIFSRPGYIKIIPYFMIFIGLIIRFWAAGYIGTKARTTNFSTGCRIINAPYKYLKHPLYIGNFFLVLGVVLLFNPVIWFGVLVMVLFLLVYMLIIMSESHYLKDLPETKAHFRLVNCKGEISTITVVIVVLLIHYLVVKNILT
jgi:protein-S-isoprenylcysteine O-methyltransferase Ste14